ncbi:signal peptide peptidase SppA [Methylocella sp.]|uniref:signal peptide peptidase SppA n=1 Tax=Methylocella sp. TaxID=1978226 RepID=UPI0037849DA8
MSIPSFADYLVERRSLLRRLSWWRVAAFLAAALVILALGARVFGGEAAHLRPHIARVTLSGIITGDRDTLRLISRVADSDAAAVIVSIDSPGGTTAGAERVYDALRRLSAKKPTAAVVGSLAASGGYIAALGADQIVALGNSLVGSIGVLVQYPNVTGLLDKVGVKVEGVKSSPLKAAPNGYEPTSPEAKAALESIVMDSYAWFKGLVRERRGLDDAGLAAVDDGRVFTGRQGLGLHLVDRLGGEREAVAWLENEKKVAKGLKVEDWRPQRGFSVMSLTSLAQAAAGALGLDAMAPFLTRADGRMLDGLVSIWQFGDAD